MENCGKAVESCGKAVDKLRENYGRALEIVFLYPDKMKKTLAINMTECKIQKMTCFKHHLMRLTIV